MQKLERISHILFIAAFFLFLTAALLLTYKSTNNTYSYFENRLLTAKPEYSSDSVLDGTYFSSYEKYLSDHAAWRTSCVSLDVQLNMALNRLVINDVVIQDDILLPWNNYENISEEDIAIAAEEMSENLSSVRDLVESYGGKYCYVAVPCQYAYYEDQYPAYLNNRSTYTHLSLKYFSQALAQKQIHFIDMGVIFDSLGSPDTFYSHVDNHYSIYGAYQTYRTILEHFCEDGAEIPILQQSDFSYVELELPYLGSRMRKLLNVCHFDEHLSIITPNDPIVFTRSDNGSQTLPTVYALPSNSDDWVTYNLYMGGDIGNTVIDSGRDDLPSILIYGDSFTNAVESIMYWSFNEMHSLDYRNYSGSLSLREYIELYHPDYVVCIRDYEALLSQDGNGVGAHN